MIPRIGRYEVLAEVGRGATGAVYLGMDSQLDRAVAIKQLNPSLASDDRFVAAFRKEAQTLALMQHPNCVRVFDFIADRGMFIVTEFVDGASLREVLEQSIQLTPEQALGILEGALGGLARAHELGIVHRDVKPENILCNRTGTSKLTDFGLATRTGDRSDGQVFGTPAYISPEQVQGQEVDARSDVYSCGAMLFELLSGQAPYRGLSAEVVMHRHVSDAVPDPRRVRAGLPGGVSALVMRAMSKDPAQRPGSAADFATELAAAAEADLGEDWRDRASIVGGVVTAVTAGALAAATIGAASAQGSVSAAAVAVAQGTTGGVTVANLNAAVPRQPASPPSSVPKPAAPARRGLGRKPVAAAVALLLLLALGSASYALTRATPGAVKLDSCLVGNWIAERTYFEVTDTDIHQVFNLPGGSGQTFRVNRDGSTITDYALADPYVGDAVGHHYTVYERGVTRGKVSTASRSMIATPGQKQTGVAYVMDRDGHLIGSGTPQDVALGGATRITYSCGGAQLAFDQGAYRSTFRRFDGPLPAAVPCRTEVAQRNLAACPSSGRGAVTVHLRGTEGCAGSGQGIPAAIRQPAVSVVIGGGTAVLASGVFDVDRATGKWSGDVVIDAASSSSAGTYPVTGGCYDRANSQSNGFGAPYGPVTFTLLQGDAVAPSPTPSP